MNITNMNHYNRIYSKMSYDAFINNYLANKRGKIVFLEASKFFSLPSNKKTTQKQLLLNRYINNIHPRQLHLNRNFIPFSKIEHIQELSKSNKKNNQCHSCQRFSATNRIKNRRFDIRNTSHLYNEHFSDDKNKNTDNMDNVIVQNNIVIMNKFSGDIFSKENLEDKNNKKYNFPFVSTGSKEFHNTLPIISINEKENSKEIKELYKIIRINKEKIKDICKDNINNKENFKEKNNDNDKEVNQNNKDNKDNNIGNNKDTHNKNKINENNENKNNIDEKEVNNNIKNKIMSLYGKRSGTSLSKSKKKIKNLNNTVVNRFELIKKDIINLKRKTLEVPILMTPSKEHFNFNFYVNRTYRKQIPLYMKHRINWHFITNKEEGYSFRWKYYPGRVNYKSYQYSPNMPIEKIKMINVFEKYRNLGNKETFFINFIKYCNRNEINPFDFIPFTIILKKAFLYEKSLKNLEEINNLLDKRKINLNNEKIPYTKLFPLSKLTGNSNKDFEELFIYIHESFISNYNYWIVKPPDLFQGMGIKVFKDFKEIKDHCDNLFRGIEKVTAEQEEYCKKHNIELKPKIHKSDNILIQKYLDKPLLYYGRKFDIRCYVLVDYCFNVFICREGHLKACSQNYDLNNLDIFTHITNYSLQKRCKDFAKYEQGNEISFKKFIELLDSINNGKGKKIFDKIFNKMKEEIQLSMNSVGRKLKGIPKVLSFQIFGYDFIVDEQYNPWILEINDNPGIEISSELISHLIPRMIDDALRLTLDKVFPTEYDREVISEDGCIIFLNFIWMDSIMKKICLISFVTLIILF